MAKSIYVPLNYNIQVNDNTEYGIEVRIGDAQVGDHIVFGKCPFDTPPKENESEWTSGLGKGINLKNMVMYITSTTQDNNPNTNNVSVRLFINGEQIVPKEEDDFVQKVNDRDIIFFNQEIRFS